MPYDILQINDMLVPELIDIANDLKIKDTKSLDKQKLIYKILDQQALSQGGGDNKPAETKKTRTRKPTKKAEAATPEKEERRRDRVCYIRYTITKPEQGYRHGLCT